MTIYILAFEISGIIQLDKILIYGYYKSGMYELPVLQLKYFLYLL